MTTTIEARRPGTKAWVTLVRAEAKMVARDTAGLIVPIGLPLLILLTSASAAAAENVAGSGLTGLEAFVLPLVFTMVLASIGIINMPSFLAYYRRTGILRRLSVTPASPAMVLVSQIIVSVLQALLGISVAFAVAVLAFGARPPESPVTALGVFALAMASMYAVGMMVAAVAPTPNSAVAIGLISFFALGALGGMFGGRDYLPGPLGEIGGYLPFGAAADALGATWLGVAVEPAQLLSMGITVVVGCGVAAALFRWE